MLIAFPARIARRAARRHRDGGHGVRRDGHRCDARDVRGGVEREGASAGAGRGAFEFVIVHRRQRARVFIGDGDGCDGCDDDDDDDDDVQVSRIADPGGTRE